MHYADNTFAKDNREDLKTIVPKLHHRSSLTTINGTMTIPPPIIGQRLAASEGDVRQAKKMYKCPNCMQTFASGTGVVNFTWTYSSRSNFIKEEREGEGICRWRIIGSEGETVRFTISALYFQPHMKNLFFHNRKSPVVTPCTEMSSDYLEVRDGYYQHSALLGRYCHHSAFKIAHGSPITLQSNTSRLYIKLKFSNAAQTGMIAEYKTSCGGSLFGPKGVISSPGYPDEYESDRECVWHIHAPANHSIGFRIVNMELEEHDKCLYDVVELYDGSEITPHGLVGRVCGVKSNVEVRVQSNLATIRFRSDGSVQKAGFLLEYSAGNLQTFLTYLPRVYTMNN